MWGLGEMLKTPHRKNISFCETFTQPQTWTDSLVQPKQRKRDMRIGTWNVRSLYRVGSFTAAARELARYKLDLVGVEKVRWDKGAQYEQKIIIFSVEKETKITNWEQDLLHNTELYQQLRQQSLLAIGCHIQF